MNAVSNVHPLPDVGAAQTRDRILEAASEVFASHGFRRTTVRQICQRADVNVAAVNYHFGNKERLYQEVLRHSYQLALKEFPLDLDLPGDAPPAARLRAFIFSFLLRITSNGPHGRHGRLFAREMVEPTGSLDLLVQENIQPMANLLRSIIASLLGSAADEGLIRLCGMSVVSQVLFYHHCAPVIDRLFPEFKPGPGTLSAIAEHLTAFSLAAIQSLARARN